MQVFRQNFISGQFVIQKCWLDGENPLALSATEEYAIEPALATGIDALLSKDHIFEGCCNNQEYWHQQWVFQMVRCWNLGHDIEAIKDSG